MRQWSRRDAGKILLTASTGLLLTSRESQAAEHAPGTEPGNGPGAPQPTSTQVAGKAGKGGRGRALSKGSSPRGT